MCQALLPCQHLSLDVGSLALHPRQVGLSSMLRLAGAGGLLLQLLHTGSLPHQHQTRAALAATAMMVPAPCHSCEAVAALMTQGGPADRSAGTQGLWAAGQTWARRACSSSPRDLEERAPLSRISRSLTRRSSPRLSSLCTCSTPEGLHASSTPEQGALGVRQPCQKLRCAGLVLLLSRGPAVTAPLFLRDGAACKGGACSCRFGRGRHGPPCT